ncbi:protein FAM167B-like [Ylistrum balloti]|uniref:protein FAM167B-like n=1 Tax=Ylistrum balloti TaxID=509963 RepID=UPI002905AF57|nr:protein FAM167B-like [Ylistrum balloti]XP_060074921.1 protein FAM167B-like [Ylistrum balloti]XP_060074922.1 protein FAM167B-like [Ylistrum balloti]
MKIQMQMLHQTVLFQDDQEFHNYKMRDYHRPSLDSISENNDDNNNESRKNCSSSSLVEAPLITVTGCDVVDDNGNESASNSSSPANSDSDLGRLKLTATRLRLGTRRASYIEWREKYLDRPRRRSKPDLKLDSDENGNDNDKLTDERKERINEALEWLRTELEEMRSQDQALARTLLSLRHDIHQLKLQRSCDAHKDMLEEVKLDMEDIQEIRDISDSPSDVLENPFKHLGVTPMNLSARRFSIF